MNTPVQHDPLITSRLTRRLVSSVSYRTTGLIRVGISAQIVLSDNAYLNTKSVPLDVEHTLIWTRLQILPPPTLVPTHVAASLPQETLCKVTARLQQDGVWGFTGSTDPPPSPSLLPQYLGALSEWNVSMEKLVISPRGTAEEEEAVRMAGDEVAKFVKNRWKEVEWETAWFVNPPVRVLFAQSAMATA